MNDTTTKQGKTMLVIEDDDVFRELLASVFRNAGYTVHGAEDGSSGLSVFRTIHPDVVLLDILMPVMDGMHFLRVLREEVQATVPVIVLTCMDSRSLVVDALVAGANDVLVKPVGLQTLLSKVESACETEVRLA